MIARMIEPSCSSLDRQNVKGRRENTKREDKQDGCFIGLGPFGCTIVGGGGGAARTTEGGCVTRSDGSEVRTCLAQEAHHTGWVKAIDEYHNKTARAQKKVRNGSVDGISDEENRESNDMSTVETNVVGDGERMCSSRLTLRGGCGA
jgi:hypothetical protein